MVRRNRTWISEHRRDPFVRAARRDGMRSRAAYKLQQIDAKDHLFRPGAVVVDLGAAPGGWSQVAAAAVGPRGRVIAVDLLDMPALDGVDFLRGNLLDEVLRAALRARLSGRSVDVVLSDMAPNLTGMRDADSARSLEVAECARDFALGVLRPGGSFLVKLFEGPGVADFRRSVATHFRRTVTRKPEASRSRSAEAYLLAREYAEV